MPYAANQRIPGLDAEATPARTDYAITSDTAAGADATRATWSQILALALAADISDLGTGVATWLVTPSAANLLAAVTETVGTGSLVFGDQAVSTTSSPQFDTPVVSRIAASGIELSVDAGTTAGNTLLLRARDTDLVGWVNVLTITSGTTVTANLNAITTIGNNAILDSTWTGSANLVTTGALNSGSITSGFGTIDIGSSALTSGEHTLTGTASQLRFGAGAAAIIVSGPTPSSAQTLTLPEATGTLLYGGGPLGAPSSGDLSSCTAYPGDSSLVTTGALNSGSITSGFGSIDVGASTITTTGATATGPLTVTGSSDTTQASVVGHTTQTNPVWVVDGIADQVSTQLVKLIGNERAVGANGDNAYISLMLDNVAGTEKEAARITWALPDVAVGSEDGELILGVTFNGGTPLDRINITPTKISFSQALDINAGILRVLQNNITGDQVYVMNAAATSGILMGYDTDGLYGRLRTTSASEVLALQDTNGPLAIHGTTSAAGYYLTTTQAKLGNYKFNVDQVVSVTEDNYVLTYDNASDEIRLEVSASVALDLTDDDVNESTAITEIATHANDIDSIASEPAADKLLLDFGKAWPGPYLKYEQVTGASITDATTHFTFQAVKGKMYGIDMATIDAAGSASADNENLRILFPNTPADGDTFGYIIESESDNAGVFAQAPGYCVEVEGGATHLIDGENITPLNDGGSYYSLWTAGESAIFRWVANLGAGSWVLIGGKYKPQVITNYVSTSETTNTATVWTGVGDTAGAWATPETDNAGLWKSSDRTIDIKRTSRYDVTARYRPVNAPVDGDILGVRLRLNATSNAIRNETPASAASANHDLSALRPSLIMAAQDNVEYEFRTQTANGGCAAGQSLSGFEIAERRIGIDV